MLSVPAQEFLLILTRFLRSLLLSVIETALFGCQVDSQVHLSPYKDLLNSHNFIHYKMMPNSFLSDLGFYLFS